MTTTTLSTGQPSTLGSYYDLCLCLRMFRAATCLESMIHEAPAGRNSPVRSDEIRVWFLLLAINKCHRVYPIST